MNYAIHYVVNLESIILMSKAVIFIYSMAGEVLAAVEGAAHNTLCPRGAFIPHPSPIAGGSGVFSILRRAGGGNGD